MNFQLIICNQKYPDIKLLLYGRYFEDEAHRNTFILANLKIIPSEPVHKIQSEMGLKPNVVQNIKP